MAQQESPGVYAVNIAHARGDQWSNPLYSRSNTVPCLGTYKRSDFVDVMSDELCRKGVILRRWHCAGYIYSPT
jgi:hypothetical protein